MVQNYQGRRWVAAIAILVCLVAPLLTACSHENTDRPQEDAQTKELRKKKQDM
jgi:outer membrane biogenesis lipoprotein LolB